MLSKRTRKTTLPLPNAGREQREAMDSRTKEEEDRHAGDGGIPTGPTHSGETGGPSPSNGVGHIPPYLTASLWNSSPDATAPVRAGDEEGQAGCGPSSSRGLRHEAPGRVLLWALTHLTVVVGPDALTAQAFLDQVIREPF